MNCPMIKENTKSLGLTEKQVINFCNLGCSVDCEKLFKEKFGSKEKLDD